MTMLDAISTALSTSFFNQLKKIRQIERFLENPISHGDVYIHLRVFHSKPPSKERMQ